ncbi:MAG: hypothetical protein ACE15B_10910 [Bryobacteraceae bacterium]
MARGWESKSAAEQADLAQVRNRTVQQQKGPNPEQLELIRKQETLILSRKRILRDMENSQNPRYRDMLSHALADLNQQLSEVAKACAAYR